MALGLAMSANLISAPFDVKLNWGTQEPPIAYKVVIPASPVKMQAIFIGGVDTVQTTKTKRAEAGSAIAKQWHDFLGFTPADASKGETGFLGWLSVNHEMVIKDDKIGDGGGMTAFKVGRKADGSIEVLNQTLTDGRTGKFFNIDFESTVGETGMNCGGIQTVDGRIWTAEEWWRTANNDGTGDDLFQKGNGVRDTADFTIGVTTPNGFPGFDGQTIKKFENFNWMVEVDPRQAKAIRKQYNWGRQGFEGGAILPDNKTVIIGEDGDANASLLTKFVADVAGDFTKGKTYVFKQTASSFAGTWVEIDNTNLDNMINIHREAVKANATGFTRLEWVVYDKTTNKVYLAETGSDTPSKTNASYIAQGYAAPKHAIDRSIALGCGDSTVTSSKYTDYYGRVLVLDLNTNEIKSFLEGGPTMTNGTGTYMEYPKNHLTNPDGLGVLYLNGKSYLAILEDLNGTSFGRVPAGITNRTCELFLLDLSLEPTINNLIKIATVPFGAEVTGFVASNDGKTIFFNSQHPTSWNEYPFNNSLTVALTGYETLLSATSVDDNPSELVANGDVFGVYPNPASNSIKLSEVMDAAIYDINGNRIKVSRNSDNIDVSDLSKGTYFIMNSDKKVVKIIVE